MHSERRHGHRYTIEPSGQVSLGSEVIIQNISYDGIGILSSLGAKCGTEIELEIRVGTDTLKTWGKIAWANDIGQAGIHLLQSQQWQEYFRQWQTLINENPAFKVEPLGRSADSEPSQTGVSADEERAFSELRACFGHSLEAYLETERIHGVRTRYLAAIILAAILCAGTIWAHIGKLSHFTLANKRPKIASESPQPILSNKMAAAPPVAFAASPGLAPPPSVGAQSSTVLLPVLPGINYESGPNFARFFVDVSDNFKVRAVALSNPDRIYFDVPRSNARLRHKSIAINNDLVQQIRVSPRSEKLIRIVLDLKCSCTYQFQPWPDSRHGVQIEVRPREKA